ncbi:CPBP family intramembrane metalloprotease [Rhodococcus sp. HNM0569]|nr:CPBP family intramembrane glutamic endopeptidase [Rhodococcus sp. HNM0569]NLU82344.1 CPBP family intramembrane metalloprotease [Rhodococcus sp. HNM0569]
MRPRRWHAVALTAAAVAWNNVVLPATGAGPRVRAASGAALALGAVGAARAAGYTAGDLGLARACVGRGARVGAWAALAPAAVFAAATAVPAARRRVGSPSRSAGAVERSDAAEWILVHIPIGTVLTEELLFRGALSASLLAWPAGWGSALHAAAFGLWHVRGARVAGESVAGTVVVTAASALVFDALRRGTGSVVAPMLLHFAVNAAGAGAVLVAARALS